MQELQGTWVQFLGQEEPLEEERAPHSSILAGEPPWTGAWGEATIHEVTNVRHDWVTEHTSTHKAFRLYHQNTLSCHFHFRHLKETNFEDKVLPDRAGSVCRSVFPFRSCMMHIFHVPLQTYFSSLPTPASHWCPVRLVSVSKHSDPLCQDEFICPQTDTTALLALWLMQLQQKLTSFGRPWS